jgi:hypothetical protein
VEHRLGIDSDRHTLGQLVTPALAVDDTGDSAGGAQAPRLVLAAAFSLDYV